MRAVVYRAPEEVRVENRDDIAPEAGEIIARVIANTICGTDLRIVRGTKRKGVIAPRILGHEVSAQIVALGEGVEGYQVGENFCFAPTIACGHCAECQAGSSNRCANARVLGHQIDGGLADFIRVPAEGVRDGNIVRFSGEIDPVVMALAEPLSCVVHGQRSLRIAPGATVVVLGAGPIGLLHAMTAKLGGASRVIVSEPSRRRRDVAATVGADAVLDPGTDDVAAAVLDLTDGVGADSCVVCVGVPSLVGQALSLTRKGGAVSLFAGFPAGSEAGVDANLVHYKELSVVGSSNSTIRDMQVARDLIANGQIDAPSLVTHRFGIDDFDSAIGLVGDEEAIKVAVVP